MFSACFVSCCGQFTKAALGSENGCLKMMKIGDLVRTTGESLNMVGIIVKIDRSYWTDRWRYWVKIADRVSGPFPFLDTQIEVINESR